MKELLYSFTYLQRTSTRALGEKKIKNTAEVVREKHTVGTGIIPLEDWLLLLLDPQMVTVKLPPSMESIVGFMSLAMHFIYLPLVFTAIDILN